VILGTGNNSDVILSEVGIQEELKGSNGDGRQEEKSNASLRYPRACPEVLRQPDDAARHQMDLNGCLTV